MSEETKGRITVDWNVEATDAQDEEPGNTIVVGKSKVDMVNKFLEDGWAITRVTYDGALMMTDQSKQEPTVQMVSHSDLQTFTTTVNNTIKAGWFMVGDIMQAAAGNGSGYYCLMEKKA